MSSAVESSRPSLRDLPLPVKLVISAFLISVGLGYGSALMQIHFQHASPGNPMPTTTDIVARFSGVTWPRPAEEVKVDPKSHMHALIEAPESAPWNGSGSMAKAFTTKSDDWDKELEKELRPQRDGERLTLIAWLKGGAKREEYDKDAFPIPAEVSTITEEFFDADTKMVKVKSIIDRRCATCHSPDGDQASYPLHTFETVSKYTKIKESSGDPAKTQQITVEKLTQSTHAHLLSFSMLFALTGLVIAFSNYPLWFRMILGPIVLIAQIADIACWWLARLDGIGPYFAMSIMATGGVVGLGLFLQITLGLFNMYGKAGKAVLCALFLVGAIGAGVLKSTVIDPQLAAERAEVEAAK